MAGYGGGRGNQHVADVREKNVAATAGIGLTRKDTHEARQVRNAEVSRRRGLRQLQCYLDDGRGGCGGSSNCGQSEAIKLLFLGCASGMVCKPDRSNMD